MFFVRKNNRGFTLLEILLVVAAIAILAGIVIVAINPGKQLAAARNSNRRVDVNTILNAVYQYSMDHGGAFPAGVDTSLKMIGTDTGNCGMNCGGGVVSAGTAGTPGSTNTITDLSQANFDAGTHGSTVYDGTNNYLKLSSGSTGTYLSSIKDATDPATNWTNFAFTPNRPFGKELPNSGVTESVYTAGNANMSGIVNLWHLNESAGVTTFADSSGNGNNLTCTYACPTVASGKYNGAMSFSGYNFISGTLDKTKFANQVSVSVWVKRTGLGLPAIPPLVNATAEVPSGFELYTASYVLNGSNYFDYRWIVKDSGGWATCFIYIPVPETQDKNNWVNIVGTYDGAAAKIYRNGVEIGSDPCTGGNLQFSNTSTIVLANSSQGSFQGLLDEVAVYNRGLTPSEILDNYKRGANQLKFQVRTCADSTCSTNPAFVGPSGAGTYFSDSSVANNTLPSFSLSSLTGRYFQYKAFLDSDTLSTTPELKNVGITYGTAGTAGTAPVTAGGENTASTCLDLSSALAPAYITALPFDPSVGTAAKTYYALKKTAGGRITVEACNMENGETVIVTK